MAQESWGTIQKWKTCTRTKNMGLPSPTTSGTIT